MIHYRPVTPPPSNADKRRDALIDDALTAARGYDGWSTRDAIADNYALANYHRQLGIIRLHAIGGIPTQADLHGLLRRVASDAGMTVDRVRALLASWGVA